MIGRAHAASRSAASLTRSQVFVPEIGLNSGDFERQENGVLSLVSPLACCFRGTASLMGRCVVCTVHLPNPTVPALALAYGCRSLSLPLQPNLVCFCSSTMRHHGSSHYNRFNGDTHAYDQSHSAAPIGARVGFSVFGWLRTRARSRWADRTNGAPRSCR